jgi:hypothetical protein
LFSLVKTLNAALSDLLAQSIPAVAVSGAVDWLLSLELGVAFPYGLGVEIFFSWNRENDFTFFL